MRVIFLGTPRFAVGVLEALKNSKHEVVAVIAQPDRAKDRKGNLLPVPTKVFAEENGIKVHQFSKIKDIESINILKSIDCDVMVTAAYGQILSREILDIPPFGVLNVHASLLPKYRGASPVQSALLNGDKVTGVTIMRTEEGLDTGDVISYSTVEIGQNDDCEYLLDKLSIEGGKLLVDTLTDMERGKVKFTPQDESLATKCRLLRKEDGLIDWGQANIILHNKVRALITWPTAYTYFANKTVKIFCTERIDAEFNKKPGEVIAIDDKGITVACKIGALIIKQLQLEGKNRMSAVEFARGYRVKTGDFFGDV